MEVLGIGLTTLGTAIESICISAMFLGSGIIIMIGLLLFTKTLTLAEITSFIKDLNSKRYRR